MKGVGNMKYMSKETLIKKASKKIVPLETQKGTLDILASLISLHLRKLATIELGVDADSLPNTSLLVLARTGCGKSHLIKSLADVAGLNVFTIDSSALSPEGYKGTTLSQLFSLAKHDCPDEEKFNSSIVIIDEFCKMKFRAGEISNPQFNLLQVIEGKGLSCDLGQSRTDFIDTSKMLFIFSGAFDGLAVGGDADRGAAGKVQRCVCDVGDDRAGRGGAPCPAPVEECVADEIAVDHDAVEDVGDARERGVLRDERGVDAHLDAAVGALLDDGQQLDLVAELVGAADVGQGDVADALHVNLVGVRALGL